MTGGRLGRALRVLMHVEDSPQRIALAFGVGVFIAFFPLLGVHTALALLIGVSFRLSRVALLTGAWINNPWTLGPLYMTGTLLGCLLFGVPPQGLARIDWSLRGAAFYTALRVTLEPYLWPFLVGNLLAGLLAGSLAYLLLRLALERRRTGRALADNA